MYFDPPNLNTWLWACFYLSRIIACIKLCSDRLIVRLMSWLFSLGCIGLSSIQCRMLRIRESESNMVVYRIRVWTPIRPDIRNFSDMIGYRFPFNRIRII